MIEQTKISREELEIFRKLKNLKVIFDVGARTDTDYIELRPRATYHLFEPNLEFFEVLKEKVGEKKNVYLNNYGLSDKEEDLSYDVNSQTFLTNVEHPKLPVKTLDWYAEKHKIDSIDFLKIDAEGFDYKVLIGGEKTIKKCRYIQYEHWDDKLCFHELLEYNFIMCYIGNRNVFCIRKGEKWL